MFRTEDGREVETREEAATVYVEQDGERLGSFTPREVGFLATQNRRVGVERAHGEESR